MPAVDVPGLHRIRRVGDVGTARQSVLSRKVRRTAWTDDEPYSLGVRAPSTAWVSFFCSRLSGLGLVMGIRQFYVPAFDRTWAFTLHRPIGSKHGCSRQVHRGDTGPGPLLGVPWTMLYLYAAAPGRFMDPVLPGILWEGWLLISLGFVLYLGTAVSSLYRARWYGTKASAWSSPLARLLLTAANRRFPLHWSSMHRAGRFGNPGVRLDAIQGVLIRCEDPTMMTTKTIVKWARPALSSHDADGVPACSW